ncbi:hypothetical protein, partial [Providencia stuartii]|uniref:hypothetical protein n=1 Tax=Providencia stuartii TaxID=588 RepID=UPI0019535E42
CCELPSHLLELGHVLLHHFVEEHGGELAVEEAPEFEANAEVRGTGPGVGGNARAEPPSHGSRLMRCYSAMI